MKFKLTPNATAAHAFIKMLAPAGIVTFQTFDDDKVRKNTSLARVFHGTLDQYLDDLTKLQQQGAGAFIMVNQGDGIIHTGDKTCRNAKNVLAVRAVFADLDGAPLAPVLEAPCPQKGALRPWQGNQHHRFRLIDGLSEPVSASSFAPCRSPEQSKHVATQRWQPERWSAFMLVSTRCRLVLASPVPAAWSWAPASRCAWFPVSITTFAGSAAWFCQSVHAALLRPVQVRGSYIVCASQVSVRALWRWMSVTARWRIVAGRSHPVHGTCSASPLREPTAWPFGFT